MASENPTFYLENVLKDKDEIKNFEGPLSLILLLISKSKIEIRDIRISEILDQYLRYLERMQSLDLEIASEFVQMASYLLYIKTKSLLTGSEELSELEQLMESLEELRFKERFAAVKECIPQLAKAVDKGLLLFSTPAEPLPQRKAEDLRYEAEDLLRALGEVLSRGVSVPEERISVSVPRPIIYSVRKKGEQILQALRERHTVPLSEFYSAASGKSELVATFLSLLELCAGGIISLYPVEEQWFVRQEMSAESAAKNFVYEEDAGGEGL